jgi:drug/metabolite transporter (DMT)-like permease
VQVRAGSPLTEARRVGVATTRGGVLAAYGTVSLVWGSTYLAIRVGVHHLPPALFGGFRFLTAGTVLLTLALALGRRLPRRRRDWVTAGVVGVMLLGVGNGLVIWAEQFVESGTTAILVVTGALWMALFDALIPGSDARPTVSQFVALVLGFGGIVLLVGRGPSSLGAAGWLGPVGLVGASSPYIHAALQMLAGGGVLLIVGLIAGEAGAVHVSAAGAGAILYLIVFGSLVGYTCYVYLLRHAAPAFIGTHTYVNTAVAVLLGWLLLDEHVTARTFVAMGVILGTVVWVRREGAIAARRRATAVA